MERREPGKKDSAIERTRLLYRAVLATSDGVVVTDPSLPDNPIVYVNPAFERITGYPLAEAVGKNCRFLQGSDDVHQPALAEVRAALDEGRGCSVVVRNRRKDGTPFWHELRIAPVRDDDGRIENFVGVQTDITGRRQAQEERAKVSLALHYRVAHSLAVLRQNLELYETLRGRSPEEAAKKMELAKKEARRSLETSRDLSIMLRRPLVGPRDPAAPPGSPGDGISP